MRRRARLTAALATAGALATILAGGCASDRDPAAGRPAAGVVDSLGTLTRTEWQLVEFRSMSDEVGTLRPDDPALYTMSLDPDGTVSMRLNCNRGTGTWSAVPASLTGGRLEFGPIAATRALCPPPSLDEQLARDFVFVRSYTIAGNRLHLSLMADGGIYVWEPVPAVE